MLYSGKRFNVIYKNQKFVALANDSCMNCDVVYNEGLNKNVNGKLIFYSYDNFGQWMIPRPYELMKILFMVTIPDTATVTIDKNDYFKCDELILGKKIEIRNNEDVLIKAISSNGYLIRYVDYPSYEMSYAAVKNYGKAIKFISEQTEELCLAAVKQNGEALYNCKKKTYGILEEAVKNYPNILSHLRYEQDEHLCSLALQKNGIALKYVRYQTVHLCILGVRQNGLALRYVNRIFMTNEVIKTALEQNGMALEYVHKDKQKNNFALIAIQNTAFAIIYVPTQTVKMWLLALKKDSHVFIYFNPKNIKYIGAKKDHDLNKIYITSVKKCGLNLMKIDEKYHTFEICITAVKNNIEAVNYIKNPHIKRIIKAFI
jgi:hypothetical protein